MALIPGTTLGSYSVTAKIGEGGMGEVWQARDTKLDRDVALKVLPEAFTSDPDRLARFEREAKVLASLNHPNIGSIYGLEEADGVRALVLELVEGPTLADRIAQGAMPIEDAVPIASQIAEALEAAHEAGVIHRDLKPANIKVREDGTVKVLDFGLAKALDPNPEGDPSQSPTLTAAATQMGVILGTAAYMSPEQAAGQTSDKRGDAWSFGVVLYEMLTGQRLFTGETVSHVLAKVLDRELDLSALATSTPPPIRRLLRRCLERKPKRRLSDLGEALSHLEEVRAPVDEPSAVPSVPPVVQPAGWRQTLPWAGGIALAVATGLTVWGLMRPESPRLVRFAVAGDEAPGLHIAVASPDIAISPNGEHIAYLTGIAGTGGSQLHIRPLDQLTSETLVAEGELNSPFFSPDGESVGFYDNLGGPVLKRVSVLGGPTSTICDLPGDLRGATWGADGTIVFASFDTSSGLWRVAAVGGEPEQLTTPDPEQGEVDHIWPEILPGGEAVLFTIRASPIEDSQIAVLSLDTGEQKIVLRGGSYPRYSPTGHLLYGVQGNLWAVAFDLNRLETVGDPVPVQEGVLTKGQGAANFSVSENGSLIYMPGLGAIRETRTLVWVDREGREEELSAPPALYESPRISPDGRYVAVWVRDPENRDVMVYDLQRDTPTRLTLDPSSDQGPMWTPDGQRVLFTSDRDGQFNVFSKAADGTGQVERVTTSDNIQWPQSFSVDGQTLVVGDSPGGQFDIHVISLGGETQTEGLIQTGFTEFNSQISADGRWIAYQSNESGQYEVYVRPFPNVDDSRFRISRDGGHSPVWAPDGQELFFRRDGSLEMMVVDVEAEPTFRAGNPAVLFEAPYLLTSVGFGRTRTWDLADDGRFLMVKESVSSDGSGAGPQITVVLNWHQELLERVPVP